MGTDYEFRCITCDDAFSRDNWRTPEQLAELLKLAPHFAAIGAATRETWMDGWDAFGSMFPRAFQFFAKHAGHDIHVFDEYGRDWNRRDEPCECGHPYWDHMGGSCHSTDRKCAPHEFQRRVAR